MPNVSLRSEDFGEVARHIENLPVDGPARGKDVMQKWSLMLENYYTLMGWDPETGKPLPETLHKLGLGDLINDLETQ